MYTCTLTQENFKGVTLVIIEDYCGPEHMHAEGGDAHGNIDDSDSNEGNSDEDGDYIGVFLQQPMRMALILATKKRLMAVVTAVMMMLKTTQTRAKMMKRNLTPLDLKTSF